ncbi:MAG: hypothetical protein ACD_79C00323G0002 [uncultured bacterium]|nr:MAG: hypothetical protein ACD_79C00323G0002 [uncultured bacterium]
MIDSDYFSLQNVLDKYFTDATLKALISSCCVSFGVSPKKISFINFVRVAWYFYESVDTFDNGGNAIYNALMEKIQNLPITILRDVYPVEFKNIESRFCKNVVLSNGVEYEMQNCLFTIHPRLIMDIMPEEVLSGSIKERILAFEESNGFFCTYGKIKEGYNFPPAVFNDLLLLNSCDDINKYFEQPYPEEGSVCFLTNRQENNDTITFTAMETMYFEQVEKYSNSFIHKRQKEYYEMKKSKSKELLSRIAKVYSLPQNTLEEVCSATPLTFRDYLNSYNGSAYGISQIMGQYNIIGRIKLKNFYVTGQSSFLPGILGSMLSSIIVSKVMLGEELFLKTFK